MWQRLCTAWRRWQNISTKCRKSMRNTAARLTSLRNNTEIIIHTQRFQYLTSFLYCLRISASFIRQQPRDSKRGVWSRINLKHHLHHWCRKVVLWPPFIDTARVVCGRVCVTARTSVRLSVCPSYRLLQQRVAGLLLWARRAGYIDQ